MLIKQRTHIVLREWENSHHFKIFKAVLPSLASTLVNVRVIEMFEFSIYLLVLFQFVFYSKFFSGVKTLSWYKDSDTKLESFPNLNAFFLSVGLVGLLIP